MKSMSFKVILYVLVATVLAKEQSHVRRRKLKSPKADSTKKSPKAKSPKAKSPKSPEGPCPAGTPAFNIALINTGNNTNFDAQFSSAKARWESIIKCGLSDFPGYYEGFDWFGGFLSQPYNGFVDDVVIGYEMGFIDGPSNVLGFAGPTFIRSDTLSPISGIMKFDEEDFASMSASKYIYHVYSSMTINLYSSA